MKPVFAWTFLGGKKTIQKEVTTGTAGNVATTITIPAGKLWLLLNVYFSLTTDANAANRLCIVMTRDSADIPKFKNVASQITASLTDQRYFSRGIPGSDSTVNALGFQLLAAGEDVYLLISNGVAGDSYKYLIEYLEIDTP